MSENILVLIFEFYIELRYRKVKIEIYPFDFLNSSFNLYFIFFDIPIFLEMFAS